MAASPAVRKVMHSPAFAELSPAEQARFAKLARAADMAKIGNWDGEQDLTAQDLRLYLAARASSVPGAAMPGLVEPEPASEPEGMGLDVNRATFVRALRRAQRFVHDNLVGRSRNLRGTIYGPNLDGTYFYRLGKRGTHGWGMRPAELAEARSFLVAAGFPLQQLEELRLINITSFLARREGTRDKPDVRIAVKHFPGGDEMLETTEEVSITYRERRQIEEWLAIFRDVFRLKPPPETVMLAHSGYAAEVWGQHVRTAGMPWLLHDVPFETIPASLNPAIVRYLREDMGFGGTIIGDWYNMGAINRFAEEIGKKHDIDPQLVVIILGVYAGVELLPGSYQPMEESLTAFKEKHPREYDEFVSRLDAGLIATFRRIGGDPSLVIDLSSMSVADKIHLRRDGLLYSEAQEADDKAVIDKLRQERLEGSGDIWNRTGVITLLLRQKIIEEVTGNTFAAPPAGTGDEERWFDELMKNTAFRSAYDAIRWDSPEVRDLFTNEAERLLDKATPQPAS